MELRHFVREVYRIIMQTAPDDMIPLVDTDQDEHMKAIAKRYAALREFSFGVPVHVFLCDDFLFCPILQAN